MFVTYVLDRNESANLKIVNHTTYQISHGNTNKITP
jgi:hypothetical protein